MAIPYTSVYCNTGTCIVFLFMCFCSISLKSLKSTQHNQKYNKSSAANLIWGSLGQTRPVGGRFYGRAAANPECQFSFVVSINPGNLLEYRYGKVVPGVATRQTARLSMPEQETVPACIAHLSSTDPKKTFFFAIFAAPRVIISCGRRVLKSLPVTGAFIAVRPSTMQAALQHKGVRWITFGWAAFITENLVLSHNREAIREKFGHSAYMNAYGSLSTMACGSILYGYFRHGRGGQGPTVLQGLAKNTTVYAARSMLARPGFIVASFLLQSTGLMLVSQLAPKIQIPVGFEEAVESVASGATTAAVVGTVEGPQQQKSHVPKENSPSRRLVLKCPFDFSDSKQSGKHHPESAGIDDEDEEFYTGVHRISRHPGLWGLGLFGLGSAVVTPFAAEIVFFSMPSVFALIGGAHQDHRHRQGSGGFLSSKDDARTSNIPFLALITGEDATLVVFVLPVCVCMRFATHP